MRGTLIAAALLLALVGPAGAQAQSRPGPIRPPEPPKVVRLPTTPAPEPPPIPEEEIIHRFLAQEDKLQRARENFSYRQSIRVQEYDEQGEAAGAFEMEGELRVDPQGQRTLQVREEPQSSLRRLALSRDDIALLVRTPLFPLTSDQAEHYEFTYVGQQPLDELRTFVFRVQPKRLERQRPFFEGVVWVDDRDFAIVRMLGGYVTEVDEESMAGPFQRYEVYREYIPAPDAAGGEGYWFPTYLTSTEVLQSEAGEARLRLVMRYTDYEPLTNPPGKNKP